MTTTTESTWLSETSKLLRNRASHIRLKTVSAACSVSEAWLSNLQNGKLRTAPIEKIERVNTWLKAQRNV